MSSNVSFIIPTYNRSKVLNRAIDSIIAQSDPLWELIIIDDGSTDNTKNAITKSLSDERIKYQYQPHAGVSAARNLGVKLAEGDYVIFLDSDDYLYKDLLYQLKKNEFYKFDIICWSIHRELDGKISIWKPKRLEKIYNNITATFLAGSVCYKKSALIKAGGFDTNLTFGENYELGLRLSNIKNLKIKVVNRVLARYIINSDERVSNDISKRLKSNKYLLDKHREIYNRDKYSNARFHYLLGFLSEKKGNREDAFKYYKEAFYINPIYLKAFLKYLYLHF